MLEKNFYMGSLPPSLVLMTGVEGGDFPCGRQLTGVMGGWGGWRGDAMVLLASYWLRGVFRF